MGNQMTIDTIPSELDDILSTTSTYIDSLSLSMKIPDDINYHMKVYEE